VTGDEEAVADVEAEEPPEVDAPQPEAPQPEAAEPPPEPLTAASAEEIQQALYAASTDIVDLRRLIDPDWGVGVFDQRDVGFRHYCDMEDIASHQGLGFVMGPSDVFRCDRGLRRCSVQDTDGQGHVFHFREGAGDAIYLNALVHYVRRVPGTDNARVRSFVRAGDGVCALWQSLTDADPSPPQKLSVFVSGHTGLVPETVSEHRCGEEAAAAFEERLRPLMATGHPRQCDREPTRCAYARGDEEITVYIGEHGPSILTVTRPGMRRDLARNQDRELAAFLRSARSHDCAD